MTHRVILACMSKQRVTAKPRAQVKPVRSRQSPVAARAGTRSTTMSTTKTQPQATTEFPPLNQIGGKDISIADQLWTSIGMN